MSPREIELDEALEKYKKREAEKPSEAKAEEQKEFEAVRKEKRLKKPGSVSRFFNQFGIGKYWERLNDYFEQEERMEEEEAKREATKEATEDIKAVAKEEVSDVKARGEKIPTKILESAARAGASGEEAAPVVAEAEAEEAAIEEKAEAAKADLDKGVEDIEIVEKESMEDDLRGKYKNKSLREIDFRIKSLESQTRREKNNDLREILEAERDILAKIKKERTSGLGKAKVEDLPPGEEFEAIAREYEERAVPSPEKVKAVEVLEEEVEEATEEDLPPGEEFEEIAREHEVRAEMEKAKVKPVPLKNPKKVKKELPPVEEEELEAISAEKFLGESGFRIYDKVVVVEDSGKVDSGWKVVNFGKNKETVFIGKTDKDGESIFKDVDVKTLKKWQDIAKAEAAEEAWFEKGATASRARGKRIESKLKALREKGKKVRATKVKGAFKIAEPEVGTKKKSKAKKSKAA